MIDTHVQHNPDARDERIDDGSIRGLTNAALGRIAAQLDAYVARTQDSAHPIVPELSAAILIGGFLRGEHYVGFRERWSRQQVEKAASKNIDMPPEIIAEVPQEIRYLYQLGLIRDKDADKPRSKGQLKIADPDHGPDVPEFAAALNELRAFATALEDRRSEASKIPRPLPDTAEMQSAALPPPPEPPASDGKGERTRQRAQKECLSACTSFIKILSPVSDLAAYAERIRVADAMIRLVQSGEESVDPSLRTAESFRAAVRLMTEECRRQAAASPLLIGLKQNPQQSRLVRDQLRQHWVTEHAHPIAREASVSVRKYEMTLSHLNRYLRNYLAHGLISPEEAEEASNLIAACCKSLPKTIRSGISAAPESAVAIEHLAREGSEIYRLESLVRTWKSRLEGGAAEVTSGPPPDPKSTPSSPGQEETKSTRRFRLNTQALLEPLKNSLRDFENKRERTIKEVEALELVCKMGTYGTTDVTTQNALAGELLAEQGAFLAAKLTAAVEKKRQADLLAYQKRVGAYESFSSKTEPEVPYDVSSAQVQAALVQEWKDKKWKELAITPSVEFLGMLNKIEVCAERIDTLSQTYGLDRAVSTAFRSAQAQLLTPAVKEYQSGTRTGTSLVQALQSVTSEQLTAMLAEVERANEALSKPPHSAG